MPAALLRVRSPNVIVGANRYTPSPLLRRRWSCCRLRNGGGLVACPAWSAPPPPAVGIAQLARGCCGALLVCLGAAAPPLPRPAPRPRGGGGILLGFAHACNAALSGRGLCALGFRCLRAAPCSPASSGREKRALGAVCRGLPLRPAAVWAHAVLRLSCPLLSCPLPRAAAIADTCSPAAKLHQNALKKQQKASKSVLFVRHIAASVTGASTDSTLKSPILGAFWAAVDAAQRQKRYPKPSTWWGAAPFRAGGKAQLPRSQSCCRV